MIVSLKDLGKISTGNTPSKKNNDFYDSKDICFIKPDVLSDTYITDVSYSNEYISENARKKARIVKKDAIFVTCIGSIGKIGIASNGEYAFNQQINAIEVNETIIPKYLAYALFYAKPRLSEIANAPVVPIINKTQFENFQIILNPNLNKQKQIVSTLDKLQSIITHRKQQLEKLDELVKARFVEMFGDPVSNPYGFKTDPLGNVIKSIEAGWSGNGKQRERQEGEIAVLKVSAVTKGYFIPEECKVLDDQTNIKKYVFPQKGDLIFSRANTREMVGATAVIKQDYPDLILPDKLWKIRFNEQMEVDYVKQVLSAQSIRELFSAASTGTSGSMYNVSMEKLKSIIIPIPSHELQKSFTTFIEQTNKSKVVSPLILLLPHLDAAFSSLPPLYKPHLSYCARSDDSSDTPESDP